MKKNWLLITTGIIFYIAFIAIASYIVITPGVKKLQEAKNIKELTYEEKTQHIDEINKKYIDLEKDLNNKYEPTINQIKEKYANKEKEITDKYNKEEAKINNEINDTEVSQTKEFFANGHSKKYHELGDKLSELRDQKWDLSSKEREEKRDNEANKFVELNTIEKNKKDELNRLNEKKENELYSINNQNTNKKVVAFKGFILIIIGAGIIILPLLYTASIFNKLTHLSNAVEEKWSQIDVVLKQRADLIPNVVNAIKGASTHEKSTLTKVTKARNQVIKATTKEEEIEANKNLSTVINRLFILQEDYPELKTNTNFISLQHELKELENNISESRKIYNKAVLKYKNKLEMFPSNIVANIFSFPPQPFFEIDEEDKENPNINFK